MSKIHLRSIDSHLARFEVYHPLLPNEMAANPGYLQADPSSLVLPWYIKWPVQPPIAIYPEALIRDARLAKHHKGRGELLLTDSTFFTTIWLNDARTRDVEHYVKRWHQVETSERMRDDEKRVQDELRIRAKFHKDVFEIMHGREKMHRKTMRLQQLLFHFLRTERHKMHEHEITTLMRAVKDGFKRHAKFWEWRMDNMFLETDTHSMVRVKHSGKMIEHVMDSIIWEARHKMTLAHQKWRHDDNYVTLPGGGLERVHHASGKTFEQVMERQARPVHDERLRQFHQWHRDRMEVLTPNKNIVHTHNGGGQLPEAASEKIWIPKLAEDKRGTIAWHRSHAVNTLANGSFVSNKSGDGLAPEHVTGTIDAHKKRQVHAGHAAFRLNHEFVKTSNGNIARLKSHGKSLETVSATVGDDARHRNLRSTREWHYSHQFRETANHVVASVRNGGHPLEYVTGRHYLMQRDLITRRFEERAASNLYVVTINGGMRRLHKAGQPMAHVKAQIEEPVEAMRAGLPAFKDGHVLTSAKTAAEAAHLNEKRRHLREMQKSIAAHDQTTSRLNGHIVELNSNSLAKNSDTPTSFLNARHWKKVG